MTYQYIFSEISSDWIEDVNMRVNCGVEYGKKKGFMHKGDSVIVVTGWREGRGFTNTMRIMYMFLRFFTSENYTFFIFRDVN